MRQFEPIKQEQKIGGEQQVMEPPKGQKYQTRQTSDDDENSEFSAKKVWRKFTLEDSIAALLVGIAVVFFLSIVSLFLGIYLMYKRKTFTYHAATDSSYPQDER